MTEKKDINKLKQKHADSGTLVLVILALILFGLIIVFAVWGNRIFASKTGTTGLPSIERVNPKPENRPTEPVIKMDSPPVRDNNAEQEAEVSVEEIAQTIKARLYFIKVNDEGSIAIKSVLRDVADTKAPMSTAIKALLEGPGPADINNDLHSLIPEGVKLLGARVENDIAFLDFNEVFRFNTLGLEGYRAQTEQVVYTATEFPTVQKIQFLIEGQRVDYLGGEGFWVGSPLGRNDFLVD